MRTALLLVAGCAIGTLGCGGPSQWRPLPPVAPRAFCPALARGDLALAAAAVTTRQRALGSGRDLATTRAIEAWLHAQPCVIAVEDDVCNGLDGLVFATRARHVQVVLFEAAIQLNPTPPCSTPTAASVRAPG